MAKYLSILCCTFLLNFNYVYAQRSWVNAASEFRKLPKGMQLFKSNDSLDGKPFFAYYAIINLNNKKRKVLVDTSDNRRLTPTQFYQKNKQPRLVVNTTFFSFATNKSLNVVIKNGEILASNNHTIAGKGKDTLTYRHVFGSAFGIDQKRKADIAWTYTEPSMKQVYAIQYPVRVVKDSNTYFPMDVAQNTVKVSATSQQEWSPWNKIMAVGGGPVLVQNNSIHITNDEEMKFSGKAKYDLHPRTLIGYTKQNKMIVMVVEGRHPGVSDGASLLHCAELMLQLGCVEAMNLDGGGSTCMLINGKLTIYPSDKGVERPVPAVLMVF